MKFVDTFLDVESVFNVRSSAHLFFFWFRKLFGRVAVAIWIFLPVLRNGVPGSFFFSEWKRRRKSRPSFC